MTSSTTMPTTFGLHPGGASYRDTTGFRYEVLTDDPAIRKAADDILFDFLGEENPCELEDYTQTMGGI